MKYHEVSFKASHNSYERDEPIHEQLKFFSTDPSRCGCRGLEFDIWRHSSETERFFTVSHDDPDDGYPLAYYLGLLLSFHFNNPNHDPIFVTLDIKSENGSINNLHDEIDGYLTEFFNRTLVFRPSALLVNRRLSLCENVIRSGWPEIRLMKGQFIFCLSGTEKWKEKYSSVDVRKSLCFCDQDIDDNDNNPPIPIRGNIVIFNMHIWSDDFGIWKNTLPVFFNRNLLTRVYIADSASLWNKALHRSASIIATNQVTGKSWAKAGNTVFVKRTVI